MEQQLLNPPVQQFGDVERVLSRAGNLVNPAELLQRAPSATQDAQQLPIEA
jgi:hypothetical protein